ncbi:MAG: response regulator transcription factor [Bacteroidetes bacterium]|nr:response regulator transcription factor [Bacteroidota bacterium]
MSINIIIAENQYLIRQGLKGILSKEKKINVLDEASNEKELLHSLENKLPDIIVIDYFQPNHFSIHTMESVFKKNKNIKFLVITSDVSRDNIYRAIESGALSFLTKECDEEEILNAINSISKGEKFICHKIIDIILDKPKNILDDDCKPINLSIRELEIIQQNALGLSAKEIGEKLFISTHTVYTHKKNIMKKLQINSSSELILFAIKHGIIANNKLD